MKTIKISIKALLLLLVFIAIPSTSHAQITNKMYYNVDWQLNLPVGNSFADKISGWGAHAESGYYIAPHMSAGAFISYHSNNKYVDRKSFAISDASTITSDQQHHIFQMPFGASFRYKPFQNSLLEPYLGVKVGTNYTRVSSQMNVYKMYEHKWGFFVSPEIGTTQYLTPDKKLGVHVAAYYSYSTNKSQILNYTIDGLSNVGVRLGLAF